MDDTLGMSLVTVEEQSTLPTWNTRHPFPEHQPLGLPRGKEEIQFVSFALLCILIT